MIGKSLSHGLDKYVPIGVVQKIKSKEGLMAMKDGRPRCCDSLYFGHTCTDQVDLLGQKNQIVAAKKASSPHHVVIFVVDGWDQSQ